MVLPVVSGPLRLDLRHAVRVGAPKGTGLQRLIRSAAGASPCPTGMPKVCRQSEAIGRIAAHSARMPQGGWPQHRCSQCWPGPGPRPKCMMPEPTHRRLQHNEPEHKLQCISFYCCVCAGGGGAAADRQPAGEGAVAGARHIARRHQHGLLPLVRPCSGLKADSFASLCPLIWLAGWAHLWQCPPRVHGRGAVAGKAASFRMAGVLLPDTGIRQRS